jgi:hypothetical protein
MRPAMQVQFDKPTANRRPADYDDVVLKHGDGTTDIVAFDSKAVNLLLERGTFDGTNPHIWFSRSATATVTFAASAAVFPGPWGVFLSEVTRPALDLSRPMGGHAAIGSVSPVS